MLVAAWARLRDDRSPTCPKVRERTALLSVGPGRAGGPGSRDQAPQVDEGWAGGVGGRPEQSQFGN